MHSVGTEVGVGRHVQGEYRGSEDKRFDDYRKYFHQVKESEEFVWSVDGLTVSSNDLLASDGPTVVQGKTGGS